MSDAPSESVASAPEAEEDVTPAKHDVTQLAAAFAIGALVGIGLAVTWIPERRRRKLSSLLGDSYRRARQAGGSAMNEMRKRSAALSGEFREELAANVEAAREELADMAQQQLAEARKALRREYRKLRG